MSSSSQRRTPAGGNLAQSLIRIFCGHNSSTSTVDQAPERAPREKYCTYTRPATLENGRVKNSKFAGIFKPLGHGMQ